LTFDSGISYRGPESVFAQDIYGGISSVGRRGGARQGKAGSGWGREAGSGGSRIALPSLWCASVYTKPTPME